MAVWSILKKIYDLLVSGIAVISAPTDAEYAAKNRTQILKHDTQSGSGTTDIYTVTANKTLYITSAILEGLNNDTSAGCYMVLSVEVNSDQKEILEFHLPVAIAGAVKPHDSTSQTFSMPVKVAAGKKVQLIVDQTGYASACFQGWEE